MSCATELDLAACIVHEETMHSVANSQKRSHHITPSVCNHICASFCLGGLSDVNRLLFAGLQTNGMPAKKQKGGSATAIGADPKTEDEMNAANAIVIQQMAAQLAAKDKNAGAALAAVAAAFSKDIKKPAGTATATISDSANGTGVPVIPNASGNGKMTPEQQAKAVSDALAVLGASGAAGAADAGVDRHATNLAKVQKKNKVQTADPRHDVTKLVRY
jgi:hypothetical protein